MLCIVNALREQQHRPQALRMKLNRIGQHAMAWYQSVKRMRPRRFVPASMSTFCRYASIPCGSHDGSSVKHLVTSPTCFEDRPILMICTFISMSGSTNSTSGEYSSVSIGWKNDSYSRLKPSMSACINRAESIDLRFVWTFHEAAASPALQQRKMAQDSKQDRQRPSFDCQRDTASSVLQAGEWTETTRG